MNVLRDDDDERLDWSSPPFLVLDKELLTNRRLSRELNCVRHSWVADDDDDVLMIRPLFTLICFNIVYSLTTIDFQSFFSRVENKCSLSLSPDPDSAEFHWFFTSAESRTQNLIHWEQKPEETETGYCLKVQRRWLILLFNFCLPPHSSFHISEGIIFLMTLDWRSGLWPSDMRLLNSDLVPTAVLDNFLSNRLLG